MTSRRLRSPALTSMDRTAPVVLLTTTLYAYTLWNFSNFLLSGTLDPLPVTLVGLGLDALQIVAGVWIWRLLKKGAVLAAVVLSAKATNELDLSYFAVQMGASWSDVSTFLAVFVVELLIGGLVLLAWHRMRW